MATQIISPEEFIAEVNKRLPNHHAYKPTWRVYLYPEGASGTTASGYEIEPSGDIGHIRQVIDQVLSQYAVNPHIAHAAHS
jgi:hypothetical protein